MTQIALLIFSAVGTVSAQDPEVQTETGDKPGLNKPSLADYALSNPFEVTFSQSITGRPVTVLLDERKVKSSFAGKLAFRDRNGGAGGSFCADVRAPIARGGRFNVQAFPSDKVSPNVVIAGNIVAKFFRQARSADECAGLQLAVWEAVEDGGTTPNFGRGRFAVRASPAALSFAQRYYQAATLPGQAIYLQAQGGGQGSGGQGAGSQQVFNGQSQLTVPTQL